MKVKNSKNIVIIFNKKKIVDIFEGNIIRKEGLKNLTLISKASESVSNLLNEFVRMDSQRTNKDGKWLKVVKDKKFIQAMIVYVLQDVVQK